MCCGGRVSLLGEGQECQQVSVCSGVGVRWYGCGGWMMGVGRVGGWMGGVDGRIGIASWVG